MVCFTSLTEKFNLDPMQCAKDKAKLIKIDIKGT